MTALRLLRSGLDKLYLASGILAALCLMAILTLIVMQMVARWTGEVFPGAPDYAGYAMAAASFFAFAHALNHGSHIRVNLVLNMLTGTARRIVETWCFAVGAGLAWYFSYYAGRMVYWSWKFNDISQGQDATALWIPQSGMLVGSIIFAVALTDHLIHVLFSGNHRIRADVVEQSHGD